MNLKKLVSTSVVVAALFVSTSSSALIMTISSGSDSRTILDTNADNLIEAWETSVNGWEVATSTSIVDNGGYEIFSLDSSSIDRPPTSSDDLVIVSLHEGFSDSRTLAAYHEDRSTLSSLAFPVYADFTSLIEISFGAGWLELSTFTTVGSAAGGSLADYPLVSGTSDFDLRLTQTFGSSYAEGDEVVKAAGITSVLVPEPSIIALMGLGLVGLGFAQRRKSKLVA
jgi:hypothetical protein